MSSATSSSTRPLDILLVGVTGFTGSLCCELLYSCGGSDLQWGVAGRSLAKVKEAVAEAKQRSETLGDFQRVLGASAFGGSVANDPQRYVELDVINDSDEQLEAAVASARVVLTTVGPFHKLGMRLARACARRGTHYVDSTGEPNFVRNSLDEHSDFAQKSGAVLIHCGGYDSVPSDIANFLAVSKLHEVGAVAQESKGDVFGEGGISGGTFTTMLDTMELPNKDLAKMAPLHYFIGDGGHQPHGKKALREIFTPASVNPFSKRSTTLWVMAAINCKIVALTASKNENIGYGPQFTYVERMVVPSKFTAYVVGSIFMIATVLLMIPPFRWLARKIGPKPGAGPTRAVMTKGSFKLEARVRGSAPGGETVESVATVGLRGLDPGYMGTAGMLVACVYALLHGKDDPALKARGGGVYTPAGALGFLLADELKGAGYTAEASKAAPV